LEISVDEMNVNEINDVSDTGCRNRSYRDSCDNPLELIEVREEEHFPHQCFRTGANE
jgi:hypothetical protein